MIRPYVAGVAGALAALAVAGCTNSKSVLHVSVTGDVQGIFQLIVGISVGDQASELDVPSAPRPITLPTSFNVEMDRSRTGALDLTIAGRDDGGNVIASGSGHLDDIIVGGLNTMQVPLSATPAGGGQPDAGAGDDGGITGGDDASVEAGEEEGGVDGGVPGPPDDAGDEVAAGDDGGDDTSGDETGP
ncbi:MAG TPA: hypothetical protein VMU50_14655 [Polyangia bacterium]|nr:hypothetical protein [Polyangia bacterium]